MTLKVHDYWSIYFKAYNMYKSARLCLDRSLEVSNKERKGKVRNAAFSNVNHEKLGDSAVLAIMKNTRMAVSITMKHFCWQVL